MLKTIHCTFSIVILFLCVYLSILPQAFALDLKQSVDIVKTQALNVYPHNPTSFTQGLAFDDDGTLWESTGLFGGKSKVMQIDISTGIPLKSTSLPGAYFGEGITVLNDVIYQLTWISTKVFVYNRKDLSLLKTLQFPSIAWGVTNDKTRLIVSNGSSKLFFIQPATFEVLSECQVMHQNEPLEQLNELEFIQGLVYANVLYDQHIYVIDPLTCVTIRVLDVSDAISHESSKSHGNVLNGIAFNEKSQQLYITGKNWRHLYEISFK